MIKKYQFALLTILFLGNTTYLESAKKQSSHKKKKKSAQEERRRTILGIKTGKQKSIKGTKDPKNGKKGQVLNVTELDALLAACKKK